MNPAASQQERREADVTARLVQGLENATLDAEMTAARKDGTLVSAWRLSDGREVLATKGQIAATMPDGTIRRAEWPEHVSARLAVVILLSAPAESFGGSDANEKQGSYR